jgi:hypothetical protein
VKQSVKQVVVAATGLCVILSGAAVLALPVNASEGERVLTPEELAEKESRKACKIQICDVFRSKKTSGDKIACNINKSWREEDIKEMVTGGKIGWRWGKVFCNFDLNLDQADLAKTVNASEHELKVPSHTINCKVDRKKDGEMHEISVGIAPVVKFKDGKAVEGRMNWGEVKAPVLFKSLIWPGVKLDNQVNVIGKKMVEMVNGFMTKKCDQVKDELPSSKL